MGGPRASSERQMYRGQRCCICYRFLMTDAPGPGYRYCDDCTPRPHRVLCNVSRNGWSVHFMMGQEKVGPWLLFDNLEEIMPIFEWGHAKPDELAEELEGLRIWGVASVPLYLTDGELAGLRKRMRQCPWNGYELLRMKAEGKYPPPPLDVS